MWGNISQDMKNTNQFIKNDEISILFARILWNVKFKNFKLKSFLYQLNQQFLQKYLSL